jgi:hypothetical protein
MRTLVTVCSRLQHVASLFFQLAQIHVRHGAPAEGSHRLDGSSQPSGMRGPGHSIEQDVLACENRAINDIARSHPQALESLTAFDGRDPDAFRYLEWLPADINAAWPMFEADHSEISRGSRGPVDNTFDWFSWDAYNAGADSNDLFLRIDKLGRGI